MHAFWTEYIKILTDPSHIAVEVTVNVVEFLLLSLLAPFVWARIKKAITAEHGVIDAEHGVTDHGHASSGIPTSKAATRR